MFSDIDKIVADVPISCDIEKFCVSATCIVKLVASSGVIGRSLVPSTVISELSGVIRSGSSIDGVL